MILPQTTKGNNRVKELSREWEEIFSNYSADRLIFKVQKELKKNLATNQKQAIQYKIDK